MSGSGAAVEATVIQVSSSNSELVQRVEASFEAMNNVDCSEEKKKSLRARYFYGIIFLITNLTAWFIRDYGHTIFPPLYYKKACGIRGSDCFQTLGVLRVSLGCFIFFLLMFLTTFSTRKLYEANCKWHSGWWTLKFFLLVVSMVVPFFLPPGFIQIYGMFALYAKSKNLKLRSCSFWCRVFSLIFLLLQLVSVIEFIRWWNKYWASDEQSKQRFNSSKMSTAIACVMQVNRGLLSSGIMAAYVVFLCWSAIRSEPADEKCNVQKPKNGHGDWTTILGFLIAIGAIVMATFSTGIDSKSFQFRKDEVKAEDDIRYNYGFFHIIFSLGATYFAMLFISWNLENSASEWSMDVGWTSTWVKIINEWFAASIYSK
ncbi:putative serine incorporator [Gossypium australe]|uniref:Putative serine incorporator n=2 Tax=Gossypium TaxID=3633 RepID=A0A5B6WH74_9ROSI|nr:putative serine incorporator [Gossypium australe]